MKKALAAIKEFEVAAIKVGSSLDYVNGIRGAINAVEALGRPKPKKLTLNLMIRKGKKR